MHWVIVRLSKHTEGSGLTTPGGGETPVKLVGTMFFFALICSREASLRQVFSGSCDEDIHQTTEATAKLLIAA